MSRFDAIRAIADTVLYEGYLLYPYTASARKNQQRWQFGVVMPRSYAQCGTGEHAHMQTDVLLEAAVESDAISILVRFLQVQTRVVQIYRDGRFETAERLDLDEVTYISYEEALEREVPYLFVLASGHADVPIHFAPAVLFEEIRDTGGALKGRLVRETLELRGNIRIEAAPAAGLQRLTVRIENDSYALAGVARAQALRKAFLSTHTLLACEGRGCFVSLMDVPEAVSPIAKTCKNEQTWPVLAGEPARDARYAPMMLSSPIILYDYPVNAPQSEGDKFDGTEVDELLNLSILTMSDEEKREARATDPRARLLVDRADQMSAEHFAELHGEGKSDGAPTFLLVNGVRVEQGSAVRLQPSRRADVWDSFLQGKTARVRGVYEDFERNHYVAVTVDDDPASDMHEWYGRSLFFYPDEIEPLSTRS